MNYKNEVFKKQRELCISLYEKEKLPFSINKIQDLDSPPFQDFLKSLAWNVIEEFVEAHTTKEDDTYQKELSDALHFMTELCIFSGVEPEVYKTITGHTFWDITVELGLAANELKNRPWCKQSRETNVNAYRARISAAWSLLWAKMSYVLTSEEAVYNAYIGENNKNKERINNGY